MLAGDFNTQFSVTDKARQKLSKETEDLNNTMKQFDLTAIYRTLRSPAAEPTFFATAWGVLLRINCMLGRKTTLNKFQKMGVIQSISSDHSAIYLEINNRRKIEKIHKYVEIKQHTLKLQVGQKRSHMGN